MKLFLISSSLNSKKSSAENPGVSNTFPLLSSNKLTTLVVCFPLPKASDISPVSSFNSGFNLFSNVLFPAPVCPVNTVVLFGSIFNISYIFLLDITLYPIFSK